MAEKRGAVETGELPNAHGISCGVLQGAVETTLA